MTVHCNQENNILNSFGLCLWVEFNSENFNLDLKHLHLAGMHTISFSLAYDGDIVLDVLESLWGRV
jgi:hypothetical protein